MDSLIQSFYSSFSTNTIFPLLMIFLSFFAGVIASVSPCNIGILPLIIGYVGGYSSDSGKKLFLQMLSFSLGLSSVLSIIGYICAVSGKAFASVASPKILLIFASAIFILGLNLLGIIEINIPQIIKKMPQNTKGGIFIFPFIIGIFFALVSSPCASPLLLSLMAIAAISDNSLFAIALLFAFALGQCIVIILAAVFTSLLKQLNYFAKYSHILLKLCGTILIGTSLYIYFAIFSNIN